MTCPCGQDHQGSPAWAMIEALIKEKGELVIVSTPDGSWNVPRIFIGIHGLKAIELPTLAKMYGWERQ